jgi:hypothetical protein
LNEKVAAEREAASQPSGAASDNLNSYASPAVAAAAAAPAQPSYAREGRRFNN